MIREDCCVLWLVRTESYTSSEREEDGEGISTKRRLAGQPFHVERNSTELFAWR